MDSDQVEARTAIFRLLLHIFVLPVQVLNYRVLRQSGLVGLVELGKPTGVDPGFLTAAGTRFLGEIFRVSDLADHPFI